MRKLLLLLCLITAIVSVSWPSPTKTVTLSAPITVKAGQVYDGFKVNGNKWVAYDRGRKGLGDCTKVEGGSKDPCFILEKGATLKNVILGANSVEHVHCSGDGCTVENVYWLDICEDALTLRDSKNTGAKFYVKGGAARNGSDKVIQHNSAGTVYINGFYVENSGKLYRACGNCKSGYQGQRKVEITDVTAKNVKVLAGINGNFGDSAKFTNVKKEGGHTCQRFQGNNNGKEPTSLGYQCENNTSNCTCK